MHVSILAIGSRGDIQPYAALAGGLVRAGHQATLVAPPDHLALAESVGATVAPLGDSLAKIVADDFRKMASKGGRNPIALTRRMIETGRQNIERWFGDARDGCSGSDVILASGLTAIIGATLGEAWDVPVANAFLCPETPTTAFPHPTTPVPFLPARLSYHVNQQLLWQPLRPLINGARRKVLGLPPSPLRGHWDSRIPVLYGFSPAVLPRPPDWPEHHHITGYWWLEGMAGWRPSTELNAFLADGEAPVCIGFGSMAVRDPHRVYRPLLDGLRRSGRRGLVVGRAQDFPASALPPGTLRIDDAPYEWLFAHARLIIHHGGAGTASMAMRAGVPSITIPFVSDQGFWSRRMAALGVALPPLRHRHLTADIVADAIERGCTDVDLRQAASDLAARLRAEDGVSAAVTALEKIGGGSVRASAKPITA